MLSKKLSLLAVLFCFFASATIAQTVAVNGYDVTDASVVPTKKTQQHTDFMAATYDFPARPKNQWEVGVKYGLMQVVGDVPAVILTAPNFGVHIRKALGYSTSLRLEYVNGVAKGLHYRKTENYAKNSAWSQYNAPKVVYVPYNRVTGTNPAVGAWEGVYYNYKSNVQDLSLQLVGTLGNINFHRALPKVTIHGFGGIGGTIYETTVNALNGTSKYNFASIGQAAFDDRTDKLKDLRDLMDDSYESKAERHDDRRKVLGDDNTFRFSVTAGLGAAVKLTNRINLALESRMTFIKDDLLDGQRWQEQSWGDASLTRDFDTYRFTTLGLNINIGKGVQPLYWLNPLGYAYAEIRNPKLMKIPKPVLEDTDGDGVIDQFDQEQTPAGCPVDSHGVSRDTDGDGVPDCKDKQLITPTHCQPVDADGVGKCPCPGPECGLKADVTKSCSETLGALPSIAFRSGSNSLTSDAEAVLSSVAARLRNSPDCKVVVIGYGASSKKQQQLSWDHVNKVINHLSTKEGISAERFIFNYGGDGPNDSVDLRGANDGEDGPNSIAPPHPNLRKN